MSDYTEHDKLSKVSDRSQAIGDFLEWMGEQGFFYCEYRDDYYDGQFPWPKNESFTTLLAEYFGIDLDKLEKEKRAMLEAQRALNERVPGQGQQGPHQGSHL